MSLPLFSVEPRDHATTGRVRSYEHQTVNGHDGVPFRSARLADAGLRRTDFKIGEPAVRRRPTATSRQFRILYV
jgi:hypothetical protein